ncbi:MAG: type I methionyl aminopeptidase [Candidatus Berkelbacteria bacterium]|nr:MAG: type I methionyl aminopeptidase [Candidatus Berkelbacteria bacterium]QQG52114.1 MAG: type I methionyl aminopeptidase [Candidatus Berkelbacteria bacterium]
MDPKKLAKQQQAGLVAYDFFEELNSFIKPGRNLLEIEVLANKRIKEAGFKPAFLGYKGYPATTCLSVNSAIVHGIPYDYELDDGDVVAVDIGINNDGMLVDTARTYGVGKITTTNQRLIDTTRIALEEAVKLCRPGHTTGDIGACVQGIVEKAGFAVIEELTGHGVGTTLQEAPTVPNYGRPGQGVALQAGMVIAVEPITAIRDVKVVILADGWTVAAKEDVVTAHFEHTILITEDEPVVLSAPVEKTSKK